MSECCAGPAACRCGLVTDPASFAETYMCCLCFEQIPVDQLWIDEDGVRWDVCVPCHMIENLYRPVVGA